MEKQIHGQVANILANGDYGVMTRVAKNSLPEDADVATDAHSAFEALKDARNYSFKSVRGRQFALRTAYAMLQREDVSPALRSRLETFIGESAFADSLI